MAAMLQKRDYPSQHPEGVWQYQEAKAKLSQVMDQVQETGMQIIVRNRDEIYVVLSKDKYDQYTQPKNSLIDFFLNAPCSELELDTTRSHDLPREIDL